MQSGATSGLNINLYVGFFYALNSAYHFNRHPLAILNISDVYTRAQCTSTGSEVSKRMD